MKRPVLSARLRKVVVALVVLGAGLLALRSSPLAPVPEVRTVVIARQALHPTLFGIGVVESRRTVLVGPTAAGRVVRVVRVAMVATAAVTATAARRIAASSPATPTRSPLPPACRARRCGARSGA